MGWVDALKDQYRLVPIDSRGNGQSDKPHETEAYRVRSMAEDVVAVLNDLGIDRTHYFGYSMGGIIGWGLGRHAPERVASLVIGGYGMDDADPSHSDPEWQQYFDLLRAGSEAIVKSFREEVEKERKTAQNPALMDSLFPLRLKVASSCDPEALLALHMSLQKEEMHIPELLPRLAIPCLLFVGEADGTFESAKKASRIIRHGRFVSFPGIGHMETWARVDLVLPHVLRFLGDVDKGVPIG